jgi:protein SCO1/2
MGHPFNRQFFTIVISVGLSVFAACGPSHSAKPSAGKDENQVTTQAKDTTAKRYNLTGRVVSIDKSTRSINVDGDEIPGFMAAMTMPYQVKDAGVLEKLSPGDQIKAEIVMGNDGAYLENIAPAQKAPSAKPTK